MLSLLGSNEKKAARRLYEACALAARRESFYTKLGVPDTLDGRFALLVVHLALLVRRLGGEQEKLVQRLFETLIAAMDRDLRECGIGDQGLRRRVQAMGESFYGSLNAYDEALRADGDDALLRAIAHNLLGTLSPPHDPARLAGLAVVIRALDRALHRQEMACLACGEVEFPDV